MNECWICCGESEGDVCDDRKCQRLAARLTAEDPAWVADFRARELAEEVATVDQHEGGGHVEAP
jgi:hypothetical protein